MSVAVQPTSSSGAGWRWSHVLQAPHRLGFLLAMVVLAASGLWWALVQLHRLGLPIALAYAVPPSLAHSAVMTFGFIPLFFAGFLFTAGPRWLGLRAPSAGQVSASLLAQAGGWLLWLLGTHLHVLIAFAGTGIGRRGPDGDDTALLAHGERQRCARPFAREGYCRRTGLGVPVPGGYGHGRPAGRASSRSRPGAQRHLGLRGGCVHCCRTPHDPLLHLQRRPDAARMAPRVGSCSDARDRAVRSRRRVGRHGSRGRNVRGCFCAACSKSGRDWSCCGWRWHGASSKACESACWPCCTWASSGWAWHCCWAGCRSCWRHSPGEAVLPLAPLHTLTMGCLGSLMLAMVTRVSCGHSGRALVADNLVWSLFWLLQAAVLLRILAALPAAGSQVLLATAASLWAAVMMVWGVRYGNWYGRARADGRPG